MRRDMSTPILTISLNALQVEHGLPPHELGPCAGDFVAALSRAGGGGKLRGPAILQDRTKSFVQFGRQRQPFASPVERDRLANIVDHQSTGVAVCQVLAERLAEGRLGLPVQVVVQGAPRVLRISWRDFRQSVSSSRSSFLLARPTSSLVAAAALEDLETGDRIDAVLLRQPWAVVHVDLDDLDAGGLRGQFFQQRRVAGRAHTNRHRNRRARAPRTSGLDCRSSYRRRAGFAILRLWRTCSLLQVLLWMWRLAGVTMHPDGSRGSPCRQPASPRRRTTRPRPVLASSQ